MDTKIIKIIREHPKVRFTFYREGNLYYRTVGGDLEFPVPVADTAGASFMAEDKTILFMRYIRKFLSLQEGS